MKYMGSKSRIVKRIAPIIQKCIDDNNIVDYIEPFVGGGNVIDHISCRRRVGYDKNEYVIELFNYLQGGGKLIDECPRSLYDSVKQEYIAGSDKYDKWMTANVGFLASYNGKWFDGGYAHPVYEHTKTGDRYRDYYQEAKRNIEKQVGKLLDVKFVSCDYTDLDLSQVTNAMIYCDPPYSNTTKYKNAEEFDYEEFWETMRQWSKRNFVLISEQSAPEDFSCIWSADVFRSIGIGSFVATEKLFTHNDGIYIRYTQDGV